MKELKAYQTTTEELKQAFENHLEQNFNYRPTLRVEFDSDIWLPIEVEIEEEENEKYKNFMENLETLLAHIPDKKEEEQGFPDPEFTLGDKLFMHMTGYETNSETSYLLDEYAETMTILVDETKPLQLLDKPIKKPTIMPMELCTAIVELEFEKVKRAVQDGFPINDTPVVAGMLGIHVAVDAKGNRPKEGREKMIELLLENGANIDAPDQGHGLTALSYAMLNDDVETVAYLLKKGANILLTSPKDVQSDEMSKLVLPYVVERQK